MDSLKFLQLNLNGNNFYSHNGSARNYYANAVIIKEPGIVISVMANAGNGETKWALLQIIRYLEKKYATELVRGQ